MSPQDNGGDMSEQPLLGQSASGGSWPHSAIPGRNSGSGSIEVRRRIQCLHPKEAGDHKPPALVVTAGRSYGPE